MTWKIQAITGELTGQEINIDRDMLVGRHQDADILLQSAEISRKHAAFLLKDQALWLQDLKSSNGTFVNDQRVLDQEMLMKDGDIVQFASLKFSVLAPMLNSVKTDIEQPVEAIATAEIPVAEVLDAPTVVPEVEEQVVSEVKTVAQEMNEQGMPSLSERDRAVQVDRDGMPKNVGVPKPAPIPEGVDITAKAPKAEVSKTEADIEIPEVCVSQEAETQKNASVGLISLVILIVLAIVAWLFLK